MILEVIATSVNDAIVAQKCGADRIELISGIMEGGVTPSFGLIEQVVQAVDIPVHVMVRPHANSFSYNAGDIAVMKRDIELIQEIGAAGIVIGTLTTSGELDLTILERLLAEVGTMAVTFHRAFDKLDDQRTALTALANFPAINRVLTSGGKPSALDAIAEIKELVEQSVDLPLTILAGSGLRVDGLDDFIRKTGVKEVHFGTGIRINEQALAEIDPKKLRDAVEIVAKYKKAEQ